MEHVSILQNKKRGKNMETEFLKNAMKDWKEMTVESIINMTRAFNIKDFFGEDFEGMAEIVITPHQVITMYGNDSMFHGSLIGYISRYITDAKVFNPIISIRCRSGANIKLFYPELLRSGFAITEDMNMVLEMLYEQLESMKDESFKIFDMSVSLQEFKQDEIVDVVKDISNIPRAGEDKNMIGIPIEEFIKINKERSKRIDKKRDNELEI